MNGRQRAFWALVVVVPALVALSAGCGSSDEGNGGSASGTPVRTITIDEKEFALDPSTVRVSKPGVYEFKATNVGSTEHALEIEGNGVEAETPTIAPGASASVKVDLDQAGDYEIYCPIGNHEDLGMKGTVTVGSGSAGAGSGTTTTDDDSSSGYGYG